MEPTKVQAPFRKALSGGSIRLLYVHNLYMDGFLRTQTFYTCYSSWPRGDQPPSPVRLSLWLEQALHNPPTCLTGEQGMQRTHGLIIYEDTKPYMSAFLKNWPVKVLGGMCLSVWGPRIPLPRPPVTHCMNYEYMYPCTYSYREGGRGRRWTSEKVTEAIVHKRGRKYQHDWLYLQYKLY